MRLKWIFCSILILLLIPVSSAYLYEINQMDTVYLGETVDISRVMSWSGQFAYFTSGQPGDYPARIVDVNEVGNMYHYYIDPSKYCVGTWYKWDGEKESAGNMVAFYIASGVRNNTYISSLNLTSDTEQTHNISAPLTKPAKIPKETHLLLARGDSGTLRYGVASTTEQKAQGYLWLFGAVPDYDLTKGSLMTSGMILGERMNYTSNDSVNTYTFTESMSSNLQEGWYSGYIQFAGENSRLDVFYKPEHKVDNDLVQILETPYDDELIPDVSIEGDLPIRVQQKFEQLIQASQYSDDIIVPISVEVVTPTVSIGDYWEDSDTIVIRGSTPMRAGTIISVIIDPDQYALLPDIRAHTYHTTAQYTEQSKIEADCTVEYTDLNNDGYNVSVYNGTAYNITFSNGTYLNGVYLEDSIKTKTKCTSIPRIYSITIPINWDELAVGHHKIYASINSNGVEISNTKDFDISGSWVNPAPTQEFNKLIVVKEGDSHQVNLSSNQTISPTVTLSPTPTVTETDEIVYVGNQNVTPTVHGTSTLPIPETPIQKQPDNNWILWLGAVIAILVCIGYWLYNG